MALKGRRAANRGGGRLADKEIGASTPSAGRGETDHIYSPMGQRQGGGGGGGMSVHRSAGSRASVGASKGTGPVGGAGEMRAVGPGPAAARKMGMPAEAYPSRQTPGNPSGISVYKQGNPPPKGYRQ
jgi:hypothetical protein